LTILLFGLMYGLRRRQPPDDPEIIYTSSTQEDITELDTIDDHTEVVDLNFNPISPAHLIYEDGGDHLPRKIPIEGGREIRIGRRDLYCDLIIDDRRISKLHATIFEQADGFYIRDDGSSGGTFVNQRKLGVSDHKQPLKDGDIINFNAVAYRFELTKDDDDQTEPAVTPDLERTQIYSN